MKNCVIFDVSLDPELAPAFIPKDSATQIFLDKKHTGG